MSGTVLIPLIVVLWLFVLAPWLLRGQRPIRKAGEAFNETRVVYQGGTGEVISGGAPQRPRRRLLPPAPQDGERPRLQQVVHEDEPMEDFEVRLAAENFEPIHDEYYMEEDYASAEEAASDWGPADVHAAVDEDGHYLVDESYLEPADLLYPGEVSDYAEEYVPEDSLEEEYIGDGEDDLSEEDRAFAEMRRGRGGYDPERDRTAATDRYQRRQRVVLGLVGTLVVALGAGFLLGGWYWVAPALVGALTITYLVALRGQVRAEQELRRRRIRQLRRARLGVRSAHDEELRIPGRLRRPGAIVVEIDDESPDFLHLDAVRGSDYFGYDDRPHVVASLDDRRAG